MYKSFKFVLLQIRPNFGRSRIRISAGLVKNSRISAGARAELQYSPSC